MKTKLSILLLGATCLCSMAATRRFGWTVSTTPEVTNYVLRASTSLLTAENFTNAPARWDVGTNLTATASALTPGTWYFAVTAMRGDVESTNISNVVVVDIPPPPDAPDALRLIELPPRTNVAVTILIPITITTP